MARPTKLNDEIVRKLEYAFANDFNITEACDYAEISRDTYYKWLNENGNFSDKMTVSQTHLKRKAKIVLAKSIEDGDVKNAMWYLERKAKDEYSSKQTTEIIAEPELSVADKGKLVGIFIHKLVDDCEHEKIKGREAEIEEAYWNGEGDIYEED